MISWESPEVVSVPANAAANNNRVGKKARTSEYAAPLAVENAPSDIALSSASARTAENVRISDFQYHCAKAKGKRQRVKGKRHVRAADVVLFVLDNMRKQGEH